MAIRGKKVKKVKKKGFTLVELLAVVVILAIIVIIAYPVIANLIETSRLKAFALNEEIAVKAAKFYVSQEGVTLPNTEGETIGVSYDDMSEKSYIQVITDPASNVECSGYIIIENLGNGEYSYTPALTCENYESTAQFWSDWSEWQEGEVVASDTREVETTTYYNYRDESEEWTEWTDTTAYAVTENNLVPVSVVGDTEERTVYRYRDTLTKWYAKNYTTSYYSTAPAGYPNKDAALISYGAWSKWCTTNPANYDYREEVSTTGYTYRQTKTGYTTYYWTGCNPSGPQKWYSNSGWAQHTTTEDVGAVFSGYVRSVYTYLGTKTVYKYRTLSWKWYNIEYYQDGGVDGYSATAPTGYTIQDSAQYQITEWFEDELIEPSAETYREIQSKTQSRTYEIIYGDPILVDYEPADTFEASVSDTIENINNSSSYDLLTKTMYKYRDQL